MPYPDNMPTLGDLPRLSPQEIAGLPVEILAILQREVEEHIDRGKAAKDRLDGALALRYADRAAAIRRGASKDTGTVRIDDGDFTIIADLPKRVDWRASSRCRTGPATASPFAASPMRSTSPA